MERGKGSGRREGERQGKKGRGRRRMERRREWGGGGAQAEREQEKLDPMFAILHYIVFDVCIYI
jgi:hypothetical protein